MNTPDPQFLLRTAEQYVAAGLSIIPAGVSGPWAKHPHYGALKHTGHSYRDEDGEHATWLPFRERQPTSCELRAWFLECRAPGLALVTGEVSRLVALDFDRGAGVELMEALGFQAHVRSPSSGYHVYTAHPGWYVATTNAKVKGSLPPGVDVRGDGGLVMLPPTVTEAGAYERLSAKKLLQVTSIPEEVQVAEGGQAQTYRLREVLGLSAPAPEQGAPLLAVRAPVFSAPEEGQDEHRRVDYHKLIDYALGVVERRGRNPGGFALAVQLRDNGFSQDEALQLDDYWVSLLPLTNTKGEREPYTTTQYRASVRSAYRKVPPGRDARPWVKGFGR